MKHINLIAFDIPYPPDYGGIIDIYYKIKSFHQAGIKVHLHCYQYCKLPSDELKNVCESIHYYPRQVSKANLLNLKPYIVVSRTSDKLIKNLLKNSYPILFEGLHTCFYLNDKNLEKRRKIVRAHNIEHNYYQNLAKVEKDIFRKYYFRNESGKLKRFEKIFEFSDGIAAISKNDCTYFSKKYRNVSHVSAFHPNENVDITTGKGDFALYHGSLEVGENNEAALFLINKVFNDIDVPLIIAGNKPSVELKQAVADSGSNIKLLDNISTSEIYNLLKKAQINVLPTFQATGIKLKLLAALYNGRHCVANSLMAKNTGLDSLCVIKDEPDDMKKEIKRLFNIPFAQEDIVKRENVLNNSIFSNKHNIDTLINMLF
jgi:glycosyltransferase involved in cell wall biosynthesis